MSAIEWTEKTWNPIVGCTVKSPGCTNCYAMGMAARLEAMGVPQYVGLTQRSKAGAVWTGKMAFAEKALLEPLRRKKPTMWFVNSMGDLFHESVPDEWIDRVFAVMGSCPQHTFQVLTKRSDRMRDYLSRRKSAKPVAVSVGDGILGEHPFSNELLPPANIWLGVSVEDQARADERIPDLLATPAAVRWLSCEPLLGEVDLLAFLEPTGACCGGEPEYRCASCPSDATWRYSVPADNGMWAFDPTIDWVVVGGESGPGARPMNTGWARSLRDQCAAANVPFFMKQMGGPVKARMPEISGDLLIRQYPRAALDRAA